MEYLPEITDSEMFWRVVEESPDGTAVERFMLVVAMSWIRADDRVLEVGANHGQHTRVFARCIGARGLVIAVEADPELASMLGEGAERSTAPIRVISAAIGERCGATMDFFRHRVRDQEGSLVMREDPSHYERIVVPVETIDSIVSRDKAPRFVKIDVEGLEFSVLRGADKLLAQNAPLIACELQREPSPHLNYTPESFLGFLRDRGWALLSLDGHRVSVDLWRDPNFRMNYQCWLVKRDSLAESFSIGRVPELARAFAWGGSDVAPYPFDLRDFPVA